MIGRASPWPIVIVTGALGSGKTTLITRLLGHPAMADTLVLVNEFGEVGLDHALIKAVTDAVVLLPNGCLCCTVRSDVVQTLRDIRHGWLAGQIPDFGRVLIETTGLAEPMPLIATLVSHPLLAESFALQAIATVVDGQHGVERLAERAAYRNQIAIADHLILSKGDLVAAETITALANRLGELNPLATIVASGAADPADLFRRDASPGRRSAFGADDADHLATTSAVLLKPGRPLAWTPFRIWLGGLLDQHGGRLMRLKGKLTFDGTGVIIQAVHHTFYPAAEAPADAGDDFLVLIFDGAVPDGVAAAAERHGLLVH